MPDRGLSYDDVLLIPQDSPIDSRQNVKLNTFLTDDFELSRPLLSAPMDTVTEEEMAIALGEAGGLGTIHRYMSIEEQAKHVTEVKRADVPVAAAIGIDEDYISRAERVHSAGADALMVDVAHGHLRKCRTAVEELTARFEDPVLIAGNVATPHGVADLAHAGADCVKVGVGPGSHCTTREVTGVGVPQFTAVQACADEARNQGVSVIADGGIRNSGDAVKALMAGANAVMMGSFFMGTDESPGEVQKTTDGGKVKITRGMASKEANDERTDKELKPSVEEGVVQQTEYKGPVTPLIEEFAAGLRSGLSYCGGPTIGQARQNAEFIEITASTQLRNGEHEGY